VQAELVGRLSEKFVELSPLVRGVPPDPPEIGVITCAAPAFAAVASACGENATPHALTATITAEPAAATRAASRATRRFTGFQTIMSSP
jgi:hypothetical protein